MEQTVKLYLGEAKGLADLDTVNPFVSVQVDSARINTTFDVILEALSQVRVVVSQVCEGVEGNKAAIKELRLSIEDLTQQWKDDPRITQLNESTKLNADKIASLEEKLLQLGNKTEKIDQRLTAQEQKKVDLSPLENMLNQVKRDLKANVDRTEEVENNMKGNALRIKNCFEKLDALDKDNQNTAARVKALYDILEMNENLVKQLVNEPANERKGKPVQALTEYVLSLPSFQTLKGKFDESINILDSNMTSKILEVKKKLADDVATLKSKLGDKLDEKHFQAFKTEVEDTLKKYSDLITRVDKLQDAMDTKANIATTQSMFDHLNTIKADKGDLVGFLRKEDLEPFERDLKVLAAAIDSIGAKTNLEIKQVKDVAKPVIKQPEPSSSGDVDKLLQAKIAALEHCTQTLEDDKVGKQELADLYVYIDNGLANLETKIKSIPEIRPISTGQQGITPSDAEIGSPFNSRPTSAKRYGQLKPLIRPPSAGKKEEDRASIPENVRSPSPPLQFTSSPKNYVLNPAKWRATATLYDSEGMKTNASVTASHGVPFEEHVLNRARSAAGEEILPEGYTVHDMI